MTELERLALAFALALIALIMGVLPATAFWLILRLLLFCLAVIIVPPRFDPAIRLKEWLIEKGRRGLR